MIKFFRKIRQKLLTENLPTGQAGKLSKYILYAVGEIVLVVVGILIALQVNNWNNESIHRDNELKILTEMNRNLKMNVVHLSEEIQNHVSIIRNIDIIMNQIKKNITPHDSLGMKYASIAWGEKFSIANSAFENLRTTGFDLISSDSLRENIIQLFNVRYSSFEKGFHGIVSAEYANSNRLFIRHIEMDKEGKAIVNDFESLKKIKNLLII